MAKLIKSLFILILAICIAIGALLFGLNEFGATYALRYIENESTKRFGHPVSISDLRINLFALEIEADVIQFQSADLTLQISKIDLQLGFDDFLSNWKHPKVHLELNITEPRVDYKLPTTHKTEPPPSVPNADPNPDHTLPEFPIDLAYEIQVQNADLKVRLSPAQTVTLKNYSVNWSSSSLFANQEVRFSSGLLFEHEEMHIEFPTQLSSTFSLEGSRIRTSQSQLSVGPLALTFNGSLDMASFSQNWSIKAQVTDFKNLPYRPPQMMGPWNGRIMLDAKIAKLTEAPLRVLGKLHVVDLQGPIKIEQDALLVSGQPKLNLQTEFDYGHSTSINPFKIDLNLDETSIQYGKFLNKPKGVKLNSHAEGNLLNHILKLTDFEFNFASLSGHAKGSLDIASKMLKKLDIDIGETDLKKIAQIIPAVDSRQTKGTFRTRISLHGPIDDYSKLSGTLHPLQLHNAQTLLNWQNENQTQEVKGIVDANILLNGSFAGPAISTESFSIDADLSHLSIQHPQVIKTPKQKLLIRLNGSHKDQNFMLKSGELRLPGGKLALSGQTWGIKSPKVSLSLSTNKFNLGTLRTMLPSLKPYPLQGSLSARVKVSGQYIPDIEMDKMPIGIRGQVSAQLPTLNWPLTPIAKKTAPMATRGGSPLTPKNSDPLEFFYPKLPQIEALRRSDLRLNLNLGRFNYEKTSFRNIVSQLRYKFGDVSATGSVGKLFGGRLKSFNTDFSLFSKKSTRLSLQGHGLLVEDLLKFGPPQFHGLAQGVLLANLNLRLPPLISIENVLPRVTSNGTIELKNGTIKGLYLNRLVSEKMKGLEVLKINPPKIDDVIANYKGVYNYKNSTANFSVLNATSVDQRLLFRGRGTIGLNLQKDITGELRVNHNLLGIGGDIARANSDEKERFIFPRVRCKGPLSSVSGCQILNPEHILTKTAQFKLKQETKKLEKKGKKAIEDAINNLFK